MGERKKLKGKKIDVEKLEEGDFYLQGKAQVVSKRSIKHAWDGLDFKVDGSDDYVPFNELVDSDRLNVQYTLYLQTQGKLKKVDRGYLDLDHRGEVSIGLSRNYSGRHANPDSLATYFIDRDCRPKYVDTPVKLVFLQGVNGDTNLADKLVDNN